MKCTRRGGGRKDGNGAKDEERKRKKNQGNGKGNPFMVGKAKKTCTTHRRRPQVPDDAGQGRRLAPHHRHVRGRLRVDEGLKHGAKQMRRRFQHVVQALSHLQHRPVCRRHCPTLPRRRRGGERVLGVRGGGGAGHRRGRRSQAEKVCGEGLI